MWWLLGGLLGVSSMACELLVGVDDRSYGGLGAGGVASGGSPSTGGAGEGGGGQGGTAGAAPVGGSGGSGGSGGAPCELCPVWVKQFGDAGEQLLRSAAVDGDGNIVLFGVFEGTIDFGGGPLVSSGGFDAFIAKLDEHGDHVFSLSYGGGTSSDRHGEILFDGEGDILLVDTAYGSVTVGSLSYTPVSTDLMVLKLLANGDPVWLRGYGNTAQQYGRGVAVDGDGNVIVATYSNGGAIDFDPDSSAGLHADPGRRVGYAIKLSPDGDYLWSREFVAGNHANCRGVAVDPTGDVIATGYMDGTMTSPLSLSWNGGSDVFYIKLRGTDGNVVWGDSYGDADYQRGIVVRALPDGSVLGIGQNHDTASDGSPATVNFGGSDLVTTQGAWLVHLDGSGNHVRSTAYESLLSLLDVRGLPDGGVIVGGYSTAPTTFGGDTLPFVGDKDAVAAGLDGDFTHRWSFATGGFPRDAVHSVLAAPGGGIIVAGYFAQAATIEDVELMSAGAAQNVFVAKIDP